MSENVSSVSVESLEMSFRIMKLEDKSAVLLEASKFSEALECLKQLPPLQTDIGRKIHTLAMITICELSMGSHHSATNALNELVRTMTSLKLKAVAIKKQGKLCATNKSYLYAFLMFYAACKLYKAHSTGESALKGIKSCVESVRMFVKAMIEESDEMKGIVTGHVIPTLKEVTEDSRKVKNSFPEERVEQQAWCLYNIAWCYSYCGDNKQFAKVSESIIELMKAQFKHEAKKFRIFGLCLKNVGVAYERMGDKIEAAEKFKEAISACRYATDGSKEERKKDLEQCEKRLKELTSREEEKGDEEDDRSNLTA